MMTILPVLLLTLLLAHGSQCLLPRHLHPVLTLRAWLLEAALFSSLYLTTLLITQRPLLAAQLTLSVAVVFLVVNHAKFHALREPLVFSDIYLYAQVISHPRLFLPFLNLPLTIAAILAGLTLLYLAVWLEPSIIRTDGVISLLPFYLLCLVLLTGSLLLTRALALRLTLSLDPAEDIKQYGFYNSLLSYTLQAGSVNQQQTLQQALSQSPFSSDLPVSAQPSDNLIVIQSESFFDARRLYPHLTPSLLQSYDAIRVNALQSGTLRVPSWGANTLRPEFAFLSGIDNESLGIYRFNPYQYLSIQPVPTLAAYLRQQGYYCIAIHPNSSAFFNRDKVFPRFGFDEFIDSDDFDKTATSGPYISDQAVQQKIIQVTEQHRKVHPDQPLFIFAITMENHGPLHLEQITESQARPYYQGDLPAQHNDLSVYLRHLKNADQMLHQLTHYLQQEQPDTLLCFYGDHVPSMPAIYEALDFSDGRTDYLIWHNRRAAMRKNNTKHAPENPTDDTQRVEHLAEALLSHLRPDGG